MPAQPPPEQLPPLAAPGTRPWSVVVAAVIGLIVGLGASAVAPEREVVLSRNVTETAAMRLAPPAAVVEAVDVSFLAERHPDSAAELDRPTGATPDQIVGAAHEPTRASPDPLLLGVVGAMLGLLAGVALVLTRAKRRSTTIGEAKDIAPIGDHLVLDGTRDAHRSDTWSIAACMLRLPDDLRSKTFVIMLDATDDPRADTVPGQELVEAFARQGRAAQLVDTSRINEGKIHRGWPIPTNRSSWTGSIAVLDTSALSSDALRIALAARVDSVVLARSRADDASAFHRLTALMHRNGAAVDLTVLFPPPRRRFWLRR